MEMPRSSCIIAAERIIGLGLPGCAQATLCAGRAAPGLSLGVEATFRRTTRVWSSASESRKLRTGSKSSVTNLVRALSAWSNRRAIGILSSVDGLCLRRRRSVFLLNWPGTGKGEGLPLTASWQPEGCYRQVPSERLAHHRAALVAAV